MKNNWTVWAVVLGVVVVILFVFNMQAKKDTVAVDHIMSEDESAQAPKIEYEFVDQAAGQKTEAGAISDESGSSATSEQTAVATQTAPATQSAAVTQTVPVTQAKTATAAMTAKGKPAVGKTTSSGSVAPAKLVEPAAVPTDVSKVLFAVQVSSSRDKVAAEAALKKMRKQGHPAYLVTKNLGAKGVWHRIYLGSFASKQQANEYLGKVKGSFAGAFVASPQN